MENFNFHKRGLLLLLGIIHNIQSMLAYYSDRMVSFSIEKIENSKCIDFNYKSILNLLLTIIKLENTAEICSINIIVISNRDSIINNIHQVIARLKIVNILAIDLLANKTILL